ncbi:hypothetical protein PAHAL_8G168500 [Panicum hallii]|uniref:Uncharacterized protein n=1 Tax=Panicum hallii TaxID=206008 RepID=A0A2S3IE77_9POAL|nr:hypothetical protein PAHAL_8G168500 [Panicum hallii]
MVRRCNEVRYVGGMDTASKWADRLRRPVAGLPRRPARGTAQNAPASGRSPRVERPWAAYWRNQVSHQPGGCGAENEGSRGTTAGDMPPFSVTGRGRAMHRFSLGSWAKNPDHLPIYFLRFKYNATFIF